MKGKWNGGRSCRSGVYCVNINISPLYNNRYEYFIVVALTVVINSALLWYITEVVNPEEATRDKMGDLFGSIWLTLITVSGQAPWEAFSANGRVIHILLMLLATPVFALPCGIFANAYMAYLEGLYLSEDDLHVHNDHVHGECTEGEEVAPRIEGRESEAMAVRAMQSLVRSRRKIAKLRAKRVAEARIRSRLLPGPSPWGINVYFLLFPRAAVVKQKYGIKWYKHWRRFLQWFCLPVGLLVACYYTTEHWAAVNGVAELKVWLQDMRTLAKGRKVGDRYPIEVRTLAFPDLMLPEKHEKQPPDPDGPYAERFPLRFTLQLEVVEFSGEKYWQFVGIAPEKNSTSSFLQLEHGGAGGGARRSAAADSSLPKLPLLFRPERLFPETHRPATLSFLSRYLIQNFTPDPEMRFLFCSDPDIVALEGETDAMKPILFLPQWDFELGEKRVYKGPTDDEAFGQGNKDICERAKKDDTKTYVWDESRDFDAHPVTKATMSPKNSRQGRFQRAFKELNVADGIFSHTIPHAVYRMTVSMARTAEFRWLGPSPNPGTFPPGSPKSIPYQKPQWSEQETAPPQPSQQKQQQASFLGTG